MQILLVLSLIIFGFGFIMFIVIDIVYPYYINRQYFKQKKRKELVIKLNKRQKEIGPYILLAKADPKTKELLDQLLEIDRKFHAS